MRKPSNSILSELASKKTKAKKGAARKSGAARTGTNAALAAADPAILDIQSRLEEAAFNQLTPGGNLSPADLSKSAPFIPGQMRFRLLRAQDLLVVAVQTNNLKFENLPLKDGDPNEKVPHLVPAGSQGGSLTAIYGY